MRILSATEIERLVPMGEAIAAVRDAFAQLSSGAAEAPVRTVLRLARHESTTLVMPGYVSKPEIITVKTVSVVPKNPLRGLPRVVATVLAIEPSNGLPTGLLEGTTITALRTGAASGVATDLLANKKVTTGLVIGAGPQGRTQALGIDAVRDFERIRILSKERRSAERLVRTLRGKTRARIEIAESARDVRDADVVCCATNSLHPVFAGRDIPEGCHVNGVGSFRPEMQEVDVDFLSRCDKIVVDQREGAWAEAGELIIARDQGAIRETDIYAEIGEVCAGVKSGRQAKGEITFFKSVGNAVQDAAVASLALKAAARENVGRDIEI
jgi:ornithine cyclodeaminase/alanine dehydrogenase-like protein (mu-crystallin family)